LESKGTANNNNNNNNNSYVYYFVSKITISLVVGHSLLLARLLGTQVMQHHSRNKLPHSLYFLDVPHCSPLYSYSDPSAGVNLSHFRLKITFSPSLFFLSLPVPIPLPDGSHGFVTGCFAVLGSNALQK